MISEKLLKLEAHAVSDRGLVRENNEDNWAFSTEDGFFILADGMGGHQSGEVASQRTVDSMYHYFATALPKQLRHEDNADIESMLSDGIASVNREVYKLSQEDASMKGMGTTLCCLLFYGAEVFFAHVGDSRIYRYRDGILQQLTRDHSLVEELIPTGKLDPTKAGGFLYKNIVTRAVGVGSSVSSTINFEAFAHGDYYMMCSDGLTDGMSLQDIQGYFGNGSKSSAAIAQDLVNAANKKGGNDNTTVVVVRVIEYEDER